MDTTDGIYAGKGLSCQIPFFYAADGRCGANNIGLLRQRHRGDRTEAIKSSEGIKVSASGKMKNLKACRMGGHRGVKEG